MGPCLAIGAECRRGARAAWYAEIAALLGRLGSSGGCELHPLALTSRSIRPRQASGVAGLFVHQTPTLESDAPEKDWSLDVTSQKTTLPMTPKPTAHLHPAIRVTLCNFPADRSALRRPAPSHIRVSEKPHKTQGQPADQCQGALVPPLPTSEPR